MALFCQLPQAHARDFAATLQAAKPAGLPSVYLAGGCFWCTEWEFRHLEGVAYTRVGYMGGRTANPTYGDITTGATGHAEVIEVTYDPAVLSYAKLIEFFLKDAHDPTQKNRQGVDVGTQYRSAIFVTDENERKAAQGVIDAVNAAKIYKDPVVTALEPGTRDMFFEAEGYHQRYYEKYKKQNGQDHIRVLLKEENKKGKRAD